MKIVVFGLTVSSSWGNGHATIWRGLCRALAARGHSVVFFERDVPYYASHRDLHELHGGRLELYQDWLDVRPAARRQLADCDAAIVTSYCPDALAATELVLDSSALRVFYDLDTPVTLDELERGLPVGYIGPRGLADYDLVLSYTGGRALDALQSRLSARRVAALYGSVDTALHRPTPSCAEYQADLSYVGTYAADRQPTLERLFLTPARRRPQHRFLIAGAKYPGDFPWSTNIFFVQHIAPPQHAALYCSSRLTLNITREAMRRMGFCPSGRFFEAAACGTPVVTDWWEGLDHFFEPEAEVIVARASENVIAALELSEAEIEKIARRALERTLEEHTAERRAEQLETILADARSEPRPATETAAAQESL